MLLKTHAAEGASEHKVPKLRASPSVRNATSSRDARAQTRTSPGQARSGDSRRRPNDSGKLDSKVTDLPN
jgi:hypothetical protein